MPKMKSYAAFDDYLADQSKSNQAIIRALREFVKRTAPALAEGVKWGNGCWIGKSGPVGRRRARRSKAAAPRHANRQSETR